VVPNPGAICRVDDLPGAVDWLVSSFSLSERGY